MQDIGRLSPANNVALCDFSQYAASLYQGNHQDVWYMLYAIYGYSSMLTFEATPNLAGLYSICQKIVLALSSLD